MNFEMISLESYNEKYVTYQTVTNLHAVEDDDIDWGMIRDEMNSIEIELLVVVASYNEKHVS